MEETQALFDDDDSDFCDMVVESVEDTDPTNNPNRTMRRQIAKLGMLEERLRQEERERQEEQVREDEELIRENRAARR